MKESLLQKSPPAPLAEQEKSPSLDSIHPDSAESQFSPAQKSPSARYRILKTILVVGIFSLLGFFFFRDLTNIASIDLKVRVEYLSLSAIFLLAGLLGEVWVWQKNLRMVGAEISLKNSFKLYYQANLTRYIPGKIWSILGFLHLGQKAGITSLKIVTGLATGLICSLVSGFLLGILFLFFSGIGELRINLWLTIVILAGGITCLHPRVSNFILKSLLKIIKRPVQQINYTFSQLLQLTGLYALAWLLFCVSFSFLVTSFGELSIEKFVYSLGVFPISYAIGYLALFSPGGWGIREGGIAFLLSQIMPTYLSVTVALVSRLMFTLWEATFFGLALRLKWDKNQ